MNASDTAFWRRVMARVVEQQPAMARHLLAAWESIRDALDPAKVAAFVARQDVDGLVRVLLTREVMERAFAPLQDQLATQTADAVRAFARTLPLKGAGAIRFDVLNPVHVDAIRALNTKVVVHLQGEVRETVRAYVENGIRDGVSPRRVGREIRSVVGLGPTQLSEVENFRAALVAKDAAKVRTYALRDKRFDGRIARGDYGPDEITKWTERYRTRRLAWNAETVARTATLDAMKQGQHLAWEQAIAQGFVEADRLQKRWAGTLDTRERPEHRAMEGETVGYNARFSNDEFLPGDSTYNCRCLARYVLSPR